MRFRKVGAISFVLAALLDLAGCATTSPSAPTGSEARNEAASETASDLKRKYANLEQAGGKLFVLEPKTSNVRIYVFRSGRAANLGHAHVLSTPRFTGFFYLPSDGPRHAQFDLRSEER